MAQKQADAAAAVVARRGGSVRGLRDAALLAVMSDGLLRVSEAAALEVADLEAEDANTLTIRRSKTDQEAEGAVQYIGEPTVARVRAWLDAAGIAAGPLFQRLDSAGRPRGRLSTVAIRAIVQRRAAEAGIEGRVSGHSLPRPASFPPTTRQGRTSPAVRWFFGRPRETEELPDNLGRRQRCPSGFPPFTTAFRPFRADSVGCPPTARGQIVQSCLNLDDPLP